jgi:LmbE family N-acetylglucosaminyl deacetylase
MNEAFAVIAAHPDDEVLGCAGTIAKLTKEGHQVHKLWSSNLKRWQPIRMSTGHFRTGDQVNL